MSPEELKKLEEEHKKAMEAINAFNTEAKELNKTISGITGK
jgi:predicted  nucleic acid-binding Zn-ribbon protein